MLPAISMDKLGRYEILEELGRGAMGTVYRARDPKIGRIVAIKTVRSFGAPPGEDEEYRRRFFREAQAAGNLSHPGIVTIYDVGEEESTHTPYIVMEYIAGRNLESLLTGEAGQRPSIETSLDLVSQLAEALDYAHAENIVHRDIKPANIIVTPEGRAKITDFGVARLTHAEFTVQGQLLGTPAYMSPEQLKGDPVDGRSDLFSLGVVLYWLLTSEKPFTGDATTVVIAKILYQDPVPVTRCNPALGPEYDLVVSRMIAKDPAARFQRGRELAEELGYLRLGQIARIRPSPLVAEPTKETILTRPAEPRPLEKTVLLGSAPPSTPAVSPPASLPAPSGGSSEGEKRRGKRLPIAALAAVALSAVLLLLVLVVRPTNKPAPDTEEAAPTVKEPAPAAEEPAPTASVLPILKPAGTAKLQILCWHDFSSADLSIWVGRNLVYEAKLNPETGKLFRKRSGGYLSQTVRVPAGKRTVRVRVKSNAGKYDRTKSINAHFAKDGAKTLEITCSELENALRLAWQH